MLVNFKLERELFAFSCVYYYEIRKKEKEIKKVKKKEKETREVLKNKNKKSSNNVVIISVVCWFEIWNEEEVWLKLFCLSLCELITSLGLDKFLFRLSLGLITCLLTKPYYNLEKPLRFLLLYFQCKFLDECII